MKNPTWKIEELILALDLYFSLGRSAPRQHHPAISELSKLLNKFWASEGVESATLRNENGVSMKIMNFMRFDPLYTRSGRIGLTRGSKLEEVVWQRYADDHSLLHNTAKIIREFITSSDIREDIIKNVDETYTISATEGKILSFLHHRRERNVVIVKKKKEMQLKKNGHLSCEACGFDLNQFYGERGYGVIECHHIKPLSKLPERSITTVDDLILLCSNCHKMIHAKQPWLTVDELKKCIVDNILHN